MVTENISLNQIHPKLQRSFKEKKEKNKKKKHITRLDNQSKTVARSYGV